MASLNMQGPYKFDAETIKTQSDEGKIGNYALGHLNNEGGFIPKYIGRSDSDLRQELLNRLDKNHPKFMFSYAPSAKEAFKKECQNYHDFENQLENKIHPAGPEGTDLKCHICGK